MVYEGFRLRSTEVDRGRPKSRVVGAFLGRPDGFGSSDVAQIVDCVILYISIYMGFGSRIYEIMDFLTEDGSNFDDFSLEIIG